MATQSLHASRNLRARSVESYQPALTILYVVMTRFYFKNNPQVSERKNGGKHCQFTAGF